MKNAVYTVTLEVPLADLEALGGQANRLLRHRLCDALLRWSIDNPDLLQGAPYVVEYDDERGRRRTRTGRLK